MGKKYRIAIVLKVLNGGIGNYGVMVLMVLNVAIVLDGGIGKALYCRLARQKKKKKKKCSLNPVLAALLKVIITFWKLAVFSEIKPNPPIFKQK